MNKSLKKAAALTASLAMAVTAMPAIGASANSNDVYTSSYVWYNTKTEKYYDDKDEAIDASGSAADVINGYSINFDYKVNFTLEYPYYSYYTKKYYPSFFAATAVSKGDESKVVYGGPDGLSTYESNYCYFSYYTRKYYTTYADALKHSANVEAYVVKTNGTVAYANGTLYAYYSTYTNKYYTNYSDALAASNGNPAYVKTAYSYNTSNGLGNYYNSKTGKWYTTLSSALAAYNNDVNYIYYTGANFTVYYNSLNGKYYASIADAKAAGGTDVTITPYSLTGRYVPSSAFVSVSTYSPYYYYYGSPYYYYGYPYYYYYGYPYYYGYTVTTTATTAGEGVPYLSGYKTKHSWSNLAAYVKKVKSGSVVQITMNGASTVPDTFMSALKGRDVTVVFNMDNGVKWTVKGTNVTAAKTVNLSVSYDADAISEKLVKKATKDAVAAAQVTVGTGESELGFKGTCTIKFSSNRANQFAKSYVYDKSENTLTLVSKSMTNDNGYVGFTASESGTYLVVLS